MSSYSQLFKRLEALGCASSKVGEYSISFAMDVNPSPGKKIFKTPDETLEDIYNDAHKRGLEKIYVLFFYYHEGNLDECPGYTWKPEIIGLNIPDYLEKSDTSWLRVFGDCWLNRNDPIAYPDPKPVLELYDLIMTRELEWCMSYGYPSIQEWNKCEVEDLNHYEPGRYTVENLSDSYQLIQQYRRAGYEVDYPTEPKNPVEVKMDSYSRHNKEREEGKI